MASILCGPMLRRVDGTSLTAVVVADTEASITLALERENQNGLKLQWVDVHGDATSTVLRVLPSVYVHVLTFVAAGSARLPAESILRYRLKGRDDSAWQAALDENAKRINGTPLPWLEFVSPCSRSGVTPIAFYLSCRRVAADVDDAILGVDRCIQRTRRQDPKTPIRIVLGGDQIYADEVSGDMLEATRLLAKTLSPEKQLSDAILRNLFAGSDLATSPSRRLVFFSEYVAHYLLSWSPKLADEFIPESQRKASVIAEVAAWERLLATVPSYMMFDDHEVADDWNIDLAWHERTRDNVVCRWAIGNAFVAAFVFQLVGNNPRTVDWGVAQRAIAETANDAIGATREAAETLMALTWSFVVPGAHEIVMLDCRTKRRGAQRLRWSADLSESNIATKSAHMERHVYLCPPEEIAYAIDSLELRAEILTIAVNTPLLPRPSAEAAQNWAGQSIGSYMLDSESWDAFPPSWVELAKAIFARTGVRSVLLLCGDVHYGFMAEGKLVSPQGQGIKIFQVTSSPAKNSSRCLIALPILDRGGEALSAFWLSGVNRFESISAKMISPKLVEILKHKSAYVKRWTIGARHRFHLGSNGTLVEFGSPIVAKLINREGEILEERRWKS